MHEFAIARSILKIAENHLSKQRFNKIKKISVKIGCFSCIESSSLVFNFDVIKKGTAACDAVLAIEKESGKGRCEGCGSEFKVENLPVVRCPFCNGAGIELFGGDDVTVVSMEGV